MTRGILVVGNESALFSALCAQAAKRVDQYAAAIIQGPSGTPPAESAADHGSEKGKNILSWNPSSPLSARTMILGAENRLGRIDEAVLVCSPQAVYRSAGNLNPAEIDRYINDQIKSWFFLVRELALVFKGQESKTLALTAPDFSSAVEKSSKAKDAPVDLFGPAAAASFYALAHGLAASRENGSFRIMGFSGSNAGSEGDFAAWLFKILDESSSKNSGRWHKYSKLPFFK
jgi:hypothetical protein